VEAGDAAADDEKAGTQALGHPGTSNLGEGTREIFVGSIAVHWCMAAGVPPRTLLRPPTLDERPMRHRAAIILLLALSASPAATAQDTAATGQSNLLRVFIDGCPCDLDFLRREVAFIEYMRDRADAQVHVLFSSQQTGAGGTAYSMFLIGLREFANVVDTLRFASEPGQTRDSTQRTIVRYMKMGLVRYLAHTPTASRITVSVAGDSSGSTTATADPPRDPWDFWVFRTSIGAFADGEKSRSFVSSNGSLTASRTTAMWKTRIEAFASYDQSRFTFEPSEEFPNGRVRKDYSYSSSGSAMQVRSLGNHFSAGAISSAAAGTRRNLDIALRAGPALEWSLFPYPESARRQFTMLYSAGVNHFEYREVTLYLRTSETRPDHTLLVSYEFTQPWGSASASLSGQQFLDNGSFYAGSAFGNANIRLFRGFSLNFFFSAATIYNQIYVALGDATDEEILLNRRQLQTPYRFFGDISLVYSFGSIFNTIVNPRFGSTPSTIF
jgi:hypothetical protein